uniref:Uncharacterized protein n=1 Tax=Oryza meridionalis TaxID=40149 RepID=A0A0E0EAV3_9ORYZ
MAMQLRRRRSAGTSPAASRAPGRWYFSLEKCQEIKIGGSHLTQVLLFTLQSLKNEVPLYNVKVVLQFAKDGEIGFGGSHSAQVLLSTDRKLTPVQCKVIAAIYDPRSNTFAQLEIRIQEMS